MPKESKLSVGLRVYSVISATTKKKFQAKVKRLKTSESQVIRDFIQGFVKEK